MDEEGVVERRMDGEVYRSGTVLGMWPLSLRRFMLIFRARVMIGQDVESEGKLAEVHNE